MTLPSKYVLPVYFLVLFVGAIILGPLLYFVLESIKPGMVPFHRAMDRALLISAIAALGFFWSRLPLGKLWPLDSSAWKQTLLGFGIAAVAAQAAIGIKLAVDGFVFIPLDAQAAAARVLLAVVAALLIPPLEETLFRGFIQSELIERIGWRAGWIAAAAIYMLAHFVKVPVEFDQQPVHLWSGAPALTAAFLHLGQDFSFASNIGKAANLFIFGLILGGAFLRAGSLWLNAGLHGGMILALLLFTGFTGPDPQHYFVPIGGDLLSSPLTTVVLLLIGFWLWRFYRHPSIVPETGPTAP